jgi:glycosyltransferase involved in cell wall biosynthesis
MPELPRRHIDAGRFRISLLTSARTWRGSCVSLANIASGLIARGHQAQLLTGEEPIAEEARGRGIPAQAIPTRNTGWKEVRALRRAIRDFRTDLLVADRPRDLRLGAWAATAEGTQLVYRYNVSRLRPPSDLVTRLAHQRVACTVFRTRSGAEQVLARAPFMRRRPWRVITGGVDTGRFFPDPEGAAHFREKHRLGDRPVLLAVGALMPEKRYPEMFEIVATLRTKVTLAVCGEGRLEPELKELAAKWGLDVRFLGLLPPDQLRSAFSAAELCVHTCDVETFGLSVAEAMACARPVVVSDGGGLREVVNGAGVLVPVDDLGGFAAQVDQLLGDRAAREQLGVAARERILNQFSVAHMVEEYERLLVEVVEPVA